MDRSQDSKALRARLNNPQKALFKIFKEGDSSARKWPDSDKVLDGFSDILDLGPRQVEN